MDRTELRRKLLPWGGSIGAVLGGALAHQVGSDSVLNRCAEASPAVVLLAGALGLLLSGGGAFASWSAWNRKEHAPHQRFIALISLMLAALIALAIVLPMIAALVIPRCFG